MGSPDAADLLTPIRYETRCGHCARTIGGDGAAEAAEAIHLHDESHPFCEGIGCPMRASWPVETDDLPRWCDDHGPRWCATCRRNAPVYGLDICDPCALVNAEPVDVP